MKKNMPYWDQLRTMFSVAIIMPSIIVLSLRQQDRKYNEMTMPDDNILWANTSRRLGCAKLGDRPLVVYYAEQSAPKSVVVTFLKLLYESRSLGACLEFARTSDVG